MPNVHINPLQIHGWPGQRLVNGPLSIVIVPAIGGRILSIRYEGKEILYINKEMSGKTFDFTPDIDLAALNARKKELGFPVIGGDKTWIAPQSAWQEGMPSLELDCGPYELTWEDKTAVMTSPMCRETGLRVVRKVRLDDELVVHVREEIHNATADTVIQKSIWNVTQIQRPCTVYVPAAKGAFRSYHHDDPTLPAVSKIFAEEEGWVEIPCRQNTLFKCGGIPNQGQVLTKMPLRGPKDIAWLRTFTLVENAQYAHRSAVEVFNSDKHNYAEVEIHAPALELAPGASASLEQQWRFLKV